MRELVEHTIAHLQTGDQAIWCVILSAEGSTPRGVGAKMAVFSDGTSYGTIGGGAVEYQAVGYARTLSEKAEIRAYDLYHGGRDAIGMVCGGTVKIGFFPFTTHDLESMKELLRTFDLQGVHRLSLRIEADGAFALSISNDTDPHTALFSPSKTNSLELLPDGSAVLTEAISRKNRVWIFGGGHVSAALVPVLLPLDFAPAVIDPRPELTIPERFPGAELICSDFEPLPSSVTIAEQDYIVVMTPGHEKDLAVLRQVLRLPSRYIGCIGSRKKTAYVNQKLREEGFSDAEIARIHAPIGIPILAKTPEEIAISIAAELIYHRSKNDN